MNIVDYWAALRRGEPEALQAFDRARLDALEARTARIPPNTDHGRREALLRALAHAVRHDNIDHARQLAKQEEQTR